MSMLSVARILLYILILLISWFFGNYQIAVYMVFLLNLVVFYLHILSLPLVFNWSRDNYSGIFLSFMFSIVVCLICFTIIYFKQGLIFENKVIYSIYESLYFSISMFTNLGYGNIYPTTGNHIFTSLESFMGVLYIPLISAYIWVYIQDRLKPKSKDQEGLKDFTYSPSDNIDGVFYVKESKKDVKIRTGKYKLNSCSECNGEELKILKYFDIQNKITPLPNFLVKCNCGKITSPQKNVFLAVLEWNNEYNKKFKFIKKVISYSIIIFIFYITTALYC